MFNIIILCTYTQTQIALWQRFFFFFWTVQQLGRCAYRVLLLATRTVRAWCYAYVCIWCCSTPHMLFKRKHGGAPRDTSVGASHYLHCHSTHKQKYIALTSHIHDYNIQFKFSIVRNRVRPRGYRPRASSHFTLFWIQSKI